MSEKRLHVLMHGQMMGQLIAKGGAVRLLYEDSWREHPQAFPLSLSMSLTAKEHQNKVVALYLWNLLPDNHQTLRRWAKQFGVKMNAFPLLSHTGEDVAGAAQLVRPERLPELTDPHAPTVQPITEADIARQLRELRQNRTAWAHPADTGYFSLPGAQPKIALHFHEGRWGIPHGRTPTTHILKPPGQDFEGFAHNEHFCLRLAGALGLPVARSEVKTFEDEPVFVTARFDRLEANGQLLRVPMEDFCQTLAVHPESKYQNTGGPGPKDILTLLDHESSRPREDCASFFDALAFNFLIGGTDAHAKNYTLLHGGGRVRLAPFYDIASALPYLAPRRMKLAMKIGSHYALDEISAHDWDVTGEQAGLEVKGSVRVREMAERLLPLLGTTAQALRDQGMGHAILDTLQMSIAQHVRQRVR